MGTENSNCGNFSPTASYPPYSAAPQSTTHFLSSGPVVGSEASPFRPPAPNAPPNTRPFLHSGPMVRSGPAEVRPTQMGRFIDRSATPPPSSNASPLVESFHRFPTPQFPSVGQVAPPRNSYPGKPVFPSPVIPRVGPLVPLHSQPPISTVPMGSPPESINHGPPDVPQSPLQSLLSAPRPTSQPLQPAFLGYPHNPSYGVSPHPPVQSSSPFDSHHGDYGPPLPAPFLSHQGGYTRAPPVALPLSYSREQVQHQVSGPTTGSVQGLVEDFSYLSFASVPGSLDPGLDSRSLPRPLDGDVEPKSFTERYPMNCDPRYLRLTTSAIPSSQSLVSRWYLPLGAVVCPLAEAPDGEDVPVVNFASTGIIRCRRCRTYVNPYVTFTDGGRKWICNICALPNEGKSPFTC